MEILEPGSQQRQRIRTFDAVNVAAMISNTEYGNRVVAATKIQNTTARDVAANGGLREQTHNGP